MRALITGGAGFIGSRLAGHLAGQGHEVICLDDLSQGTYDAVPPGCCLMVRSVLDGLPDLGVDVVYHLAAFASESLSHDQRVRTWRTNALGTAAVVESVLSWSRRPRVVLTSSVAVLGETAQPADESAQPSPLDPYGASKLAAELELLTAHRRHGLDACIVRLSNVYGAGQLVQPARNVVALWMQQALEGQPLTVTGDGMQWRGFSPVDQLLEPLERCAEQTPHRLYHLGAEPRRVIQMALMTAGVCSRPGEVQYVAARPCEPRAAMMVSGRAVRDLGYDPRPDSAALSRMWDWTRSRWLARRGSACSVMPAG